LSYSLNFLPKNIPKLLCLIAAPIPQNHFECDGTTDEGGKGEVNRSHAATAQSGMNLVTAYLCWRLIRHNQNLWLGQ